MNKKKKMNVLWIMSDQLRYDYLSCYGATHIHTPNIDWLASQGVRFDKAYVQSPIWASRLGSYTGRYSRVMAHAGTALPCLLVNQLWVIICVNWG